MYSADLSRAFATAWQAGSSLEPTCSVAPPLGPQLRDGEGVAHRADGNHSLSIQTKATMSVPQAAPCVVRWQGPESSADAAHTLEVKSPKH